MRMGTMTMTLAKLILVVIILCVHLTSGSTTMNESTTPVPGTEIDVPTTKSSLERKIAGASDKQRKQLEKILGEWESQDGSLARITLENAILSGGLGLVAGLIIGFFIYCYVVHKYGPFQMRRSHRRGCFTASPPEEAYSLAPFFERMQFKLLPQNHPVTNPRNPVIHL